MNIGNVKLDNSYILAPMAGVTDLPFRLLCKEQGAGLVCLEVILGKRPQNKNRGVQRFLLFIFCLVTRFSSDRGLEASGGSMKSFMAIWNKSSAVLNCSEHTSRSCWAGIWI